MGHKTISKGRAKTCPVTTFDDLWEQAYDHFRQEIDKWDVSKLVPLDHSMLRPTTPERLQLGSDVWTRIGMPALLFRAGQGFQVKTAPDEQCTHLHTDLKAGAANLHIDYFSLATWGPVGGFSGYIVSLDGVVLGAGGHWAQPPGGGCRNWPLAVLVGSRELVTAYSPESTVLTFEPQGDAYLCKSVALWRRANKRGRGKKS